MAKSTLISSNITIDDDIDRIELFGIKYSGDFFRYFSMTAPRDTYFQVKKDDNDVIIIFLHLKIRVTRCRH